MATKALSFLLAAAGGAGFLYRGQLQSLVNPRTPAMTHQAPEGVYYMRAAYTFQTAAGPVHWSPGQELRVAARTEATDDEVTLTDGRNILPVAQTDVTRDMDDAAALRRAGEDGRAGERLLAAQPQQPTPDSDRLVAGHFHSGTLDAPAERTNRPENIVSTASAPVIYSTYPVVYTTSRTVIVQRAGQPATVRTVGAQQRTVAPRNPGPVVRSTPAATR